MVHFLQASLLGFVEGVTEFLPISSTGHLILTAHLLRLEETNFLKSFEIIIQLGAILAVVALYAKRLLVSRALVQRVLMGFLPTAFVGLLFYKKIKQLLGDSSVVLWSLAIGGVVMIVFELWQRHRKIVAPAPMKSVEEITYLHACTIGLFQSLAMIPGVSRSAATILGTMLMGYQRKVAVEFSFLLAIPTMVAATGLDVIKNRALFSGEQAFVLVVGFLTAFVVAFVVAKWFLRFMERHGLIGFGIYRIGAALVFWLLLRTTF